MLHVLELFTHPGCFSREGARKLIQTVLAVGIPTEKKLRMFLEEEVHE